MVEINRWDRWRNMKNIINAMVVLLSLCIALLVGMQQLSLGTYFILIGVEYLAVLMLNRGFRKATYHFFKPKGAFGVENKHYGVVHLESLEKDLEQMEPIAFEYFIRDLLRANGYQAKTTPSTKDFGADVIAKKGQEVLAVQVKHRNSSDWSVSNDAVQQAVASMAIYKADRSMVITNGIFTEHALKQALPNQTLMIDGKQLRRMVYHWSGQESKQEAEEDEVMEGLEKASLEAVSDRTSLEKRFE